MKPLTVRRGIVVVNAAAAALSMAVLAYPMGSALSQQPPVNDKAMSGHGQMPDNMQHDHRQMMQQPKIGIRKRRPMQRRRFSSRSMRHVSCG